MWSIKDYLLSGALDGISKDFDVVGWVPGDLLQGTRKLSQDLGLARVSFLPFLAFDPGRTFDIACKLQKSLLYERHDVETERITQRRKNSRSVGKVRSPWLNRASRAVRLVAKSPLADPLDAALLRLRERSIPADLYSTVFERRRIDAVLTTDPTKRNEDPIYFEAKRRGIPIATLVLSWDNLTTKGIIHRGFDQVMVWNDLMRSEVLGMYPDYTEDRVHAVGFPRFDVYGRPRPPLFQRERFLAGLGLDPAKKVILLASCNSNYFRAQGQVFKHVVDSMRRGLLGSDVQALIRAHPHDPDDAYDDFRNIGGVAVWPGPERKGVLSTQVPRPDELDVLAATIAASSVMVTAGSTVILDAALLDVPIVCIAYDGDEGLAYEDSIAKVYEFSHQKPLHGIGGTDLSRSRDEMVAAIRGALADPSVRKAERATMVSRYLGGRSSSVDRMRSVLGHLLDRRLSRQPSGQYVT